MPRARINLWKEALAAGRDELRRAFLAKTSAAELLRRHSALVDRLLKQIWKAHNLPPKTALLAVGGYGRGQLFPYSDIDLLLLLPAAADTQLQHQLEALIGVLWDIGLEVGHSVRTIDQCVEIAGQDITVQTTLLEARLLTGDRKLFDRFSKRMGDELDAPAFLQAKRLEQQQRHTRFQDSNLEPNVKESAGGLRDLHNILWISRASDIGRSWGELARRGLLTPDEALSIKRHEMVLLNLRIRLHYLAGRREDRLLFDHQTALARQMKLQDRPHRLASEQLMQRYYRTAKQVSQLNIILLQNLGARIMPRQDREYHAINQRFGARGELLEARTERLFEQKPEAILESFVLLQKHHELKGMTAATLRALWRARHRINPAFRRNPVNRDLFMQLLRTPSRLVRELRRMNQYSILGAYLPAFGRVVGQMQHDLYHVYTVDQHILKVMRNLRRFAVPELAHEFPLCSRLMSDFERPEVLYLAGLFHDIAKGRGGDHSQLGKSDALRFCKAHGLMQEDAELVAWLVEHHLVMSATAQKKDLTDPGVMRAFAETAGDQRHLAALYLLTVADIRGTSPKVWNAWKAKLLEDLFQVTQQRLAGHRVSLESGLQARQQEAMARLRLYALAEQAHEKFWAELDTAYFLRHEPQEIAWHTRLLYYRVNATTPVVKARLSAVGEGLQVMVYVPDQKELFARICSFFEGISYDIYEAQIYTTHHGYALDSFQVHDPANKRPQYRDLISYIEYELGERLRRQLPLPPLTKPRLSRQLRHFPISPDVNIQPDDKGTYHVLFITAGDRPGLLSRVARVLNAYNIDLHTAKINTLGSRAEDVFLVTGATLRDPKTVVRFEHELIEQLKI
ncbi:MAG: [protein-PII] uridylyltransferase [Burkholderiales bacterium]|nr:[protein-PII] uridylyltransferase [Burkholderiales bacterium]